ncbi:MAG: TIGR04084 family radical SAM/SPASM domain-containing protein [Candidatus Thorarchaeota archaeon]
MNYHLILTRQCNLNCQYCHGGEEFGSETELQYAVDELETFLKKDPNPQLMFYGGEPTLRISLLMEIMNRFPDARFMLQTNALLLHQIPVRFIRQIHSILVSIDGIRQVTDEYRSPGVYDRVLKNVKWLYQEGFSGDVVARMAVSEQSDIYRDVRHLLDLQDPHFQHVHWQLNVIWDAEGNWTNFDNWVLNSYNPGIARLIKEWVDRMKEGVVEGIVPFLPVMHDLLTGQSSPLRCGAGHDTFAIHADGSIGICPISPDWPLSIVGDIRTTTPDQLTDIMAVDNPCPSCPEYRLCAGRCMFANKNQLWGEEGFSKVCNTVKHLLTCLKQVQPDVQGLIEAGVISLNDFAYPEFNNGCEIIP